MPWRLILPSAPNLAVLLGMGGLLLIFVEFNRPGRILPGATGLLLALFGVAALLQNGGFRASAGGAILAAALILLANLLWRVPMPVLLLATASAVAGLRFLAPPGRAQQVSLPVAILCGSLLGVSSIVLTRIALRARRAKALD